MSSSSTDPHKNPGPETHHGSQKTANRVALRAAESQVKLSFWEVDSYKHHLVPEEFYYYPSVSDLGGGVFKDDGSLRPWNHWSRSLSVQLGPLYRPQKHPASQGFCRWWGKVLPLCSCYSEQSFAPICFTSLSEMFKPRILHPQQQSLNLLGLWYFQRLSC